MGDSQLEAKGGIYSPGAWFSLANPDIEVTYAGDTRTGVNGEADPIADNNTNEGRANNRRVEIILEREAK